MSNTMAAAVITAPRELRVDEVPVPDPEPGQVRIRLSGCGVCASNIPPWEGREWFDYPMGPGALGHEGWGVVDAVGSGVDDLREGDAVAFLSDKSYAEYDTASADQVVQLPDELRDREFPGEPLGCAMNIFNDCEIQPGETVAVVGAGFLGTLLTGMAHQAGARVIALARRDDSLEQARRAGADTTIRLDDHWQIIEQVKDLTGGDFCDCVIEATGKPWPLDLAAELTGEKGWLVVAGFHQDGPRQINMQLWNWRGLTVINTHWRDPADYIGGIRSAVEAVRDERLDPRPLFTHRYALNQLDEALEAARQRPAGFMKGLVVMGATP